VASGASILVLASLLAIGCRSGNADRGAPGPAARDAGAAPGPGRARGPALWSRAFAPAGGKGGAKALAVAAGRGGELVVAGFFSGRVDFGGGPLESQGAGSGFVAKLDPEGKHLWSRQFSGPGLAVAAALALDAAQNVVVTGTLDGAADFGGGRLKSAGLTDVFVAKLDPEGKHLWSRRFGDTAEQEAGGVAVALDGSVVLAGSFEGTVDFGGGILTSSGEDDVFVAKLDAAGKHLWSKRFGDAHAQHGRAVAVDAAGNVVLAGDAHGAIDLGADTRASPDATSPFVARFDPGGRLLSGRLFAAERLSVVEPHALALDRGGAAFVAGTLRGAVDLGSGPLQSTGDRGLDVFVAKLDGAGAHAWSGRFGDGSYEEALAIAIDAGGSAVVAGKLQGSVDFGGGPLQSAGLDDVFLARFDPAGRHLASLRFGDPDRQEATGVAVDPGGNVALCGNLQGTVDFGAGSLAGPSAFLVKLGPL
jgi:hypothetical protein